MASGQAGKGLKFVRGAGVKGVEAKDRNPLLWDPRVHQTPLKLPAEADEH